MPFVAGCGAGGGGGGHGGGGGGGGQTMVSGTVSAPPGSRAYQSPASKTALTPVSVSRGSSSLAPLAGAVVTLGRVDQTGKQFQSGGVTTTTDTLGRYSLPFPPGFPPAVNTVVVVGVGSGLMGNIADGTSADINPDTTAAVQVLFGGARDNSVLISDLSMSDVDAYRTAAVSAAAGAAVGSDIATSITNAAAAILANPTALALLNKAIGTAKNTVVTSFPLDWSAQQQGNDFRYRVTLADGTTGTSEAMVGPPISLTGITNPVGQWEFFTNGVEDQSIFFTTDAGAGLQIWGEQHFHPTACVRITTTGEKVPNHLLPGQSSSGNASSTLLSGSCELANGPWSVLFVDVETVTVPAGTFPNCLKLRFTRTVVNGGVTSTLTTTLRLAPGVGPVKIVNPDGAVLVLTSANVNGQTIGGTR